MGDRRWAARPSRISPAGRFDAQAAMEADYLRMCRLRRMSYGELSALFAGPPDEAAPWIETAARYGLAEAQLRLGQMRLDGLGGPMDEAAAMTWFTRAARSGAPEAMNMLGRCHENGWGTDTDLVAAADWYRRSAEAGYDWGEYNYANMLFDGRGVARDQVEAVSWYQRAADRGHARAMNLLARCLEEGWGARRDPIAARDWFRRSAEAGYFRARFNHGTVLAGLGRIDEAMAWFEAACREAPRDSLRAMLDVLLRQAHPRLTDFARSFARRAQMDSDRRIEAQAC